jgi:hypothetical protein
LQSIKCSPTGAGGLFDWRLPQRRKNSVKMTIHPVFKAVPASHVHCSERSDFSPIFFWNASKCLLVPDVFGMRLFFGLIPDRRVLYLLSGRNKVKIFGVLSGRWLGRLFCATIGCVSFS